MALEKTSCETHRWLYFHHAGYGKESGRIRPGAKKHWQSRWHTALIFIDSATQPINLRPVP